MERTLCRQISVEYEEEIERWKGLYEEQSIREQELTKNKYQVYGIIIVNFERRSMHSISFYIFCVKISSKV